MAVHPHNLTPITDHMPGPALAFAYDRDPGQHRGWHNHRLGQLVYSVEGSLKVDTHRHSWILPPERALWIPPLIRHAVTSLTRSKLRSIYLDPDHYGAVPGACSVVQVTPLLRELILAFMEYPRPFSLDGPEGRLIAALVDQIAGSPAAPCHLPMPGTARLRALADRVADAPRETPPLDRLAREAGMSVRTFQRHFTRETGMTFRAWQQQARLLKSLEYLSRGMSIGEISHEVGYENPSTFIAAFRKVFRTTPGRYFAPS